MKPQSATAFNGFAQPSLTLHVSPPRFDQT